MMVYRDILLFLLFGQFRWKMNEASIFVNMLPFQVEQFSASHACVICHRDQCSQVWKDSTQEGLLIVRIFIFDNSYTYPGSCHRNKYYINGHGFHNFASFLVIGFAFRWVNYNEQKGGRK